MSHEQSCIGTDLSCALNGCSEWKLLIDKSSGLVVGCARVEGPLIEGVFDDVAVRDSVRVGLMVDAGDFVYWLTDIEDINLHMANARGGVQ